VNLPDDEQMIALIERVGAGDQAAMGELWDAVSPWVYGVLLRMLRDEEAAELLTRRTFVEIWQAAPLWDQHVGRPLLWSLAMARSLGEQWLAERRRAHRDDAGPTMEERAAARDDHSQVGGVLASMGGEREVLEAAWFSYPADDGARTPASSDFGPLIRRFAALLAR